MRDADIAFIYIITHPASPVFQVQTARSHGLPAARMVDVAAVQGRLQAAFERRQPLTASLLRSCLGAAAVAGSTTPLLSALIYACPASRCCALALLCLGL